MSFKDFRRKQAEIAVAIVYQLMASWVRMVHAGNMVSGLSPKKNYEVEKNWFCYSSLKRPHSPTPNTWTQYWPILQNPFYLPTVLCSFSHPINISSSTQLIFQLEVCWEENSDEIIHTKVWMTSQED